MKLILNEVHKEYEGKILKANITKYIELWDANIVTPFLADDQDWYYGRYKYDYDKSYLKMTVFTKFKKIIRFIVKDEPRGEIIKFYANINRIQLCKLYCISIKSWFCKRKNIMWIINISIAILAIITNILFVFLKK